MAIPFNRNLRCLTMRQPWASLLAGGAKKNETRGWQTTYRGLVAISTSANMSNEELAMCLREPFASGLKRCGYIDTDGNADAADLPLGKFIAVGRLDAITPTDVYRIDPNHPKTRAEYAFGNFQPGRQVWHFNDMRAFPRNLWVPAHGQQSLWTPDAALHHELLGIFLGLAEGVVGTIKPDHLQL